MRGREKFGDSSDNMALKVSTGGHNLLEMAKNFDSFTESTPPTWVIFCRISTIITAQNNIVAELPRIIPRYL